MLTQTDFKFACVYASSILKKLELAHSVISGDEAKFLSRWIKRFVSKFHTTVCLIDREIQMTIYKLQNAGRPTKKNNSAFQYNCEVAHNMWDYRGLPSIAQNGC